MSVMRIACPAVLLACTAGCASMHDSTTSTYVSPRSSSSAMAQHDEAYMARINHAAQMRGIDVTWINPPRKHGTPQTPSR